LICGSRADVILGGVQQKVLERVDAVLEHKGSYKKAQTSPRKEKTEYVRLLRLTLVLGPHRPCV